MASKKPKAAPTDDELNQLLEGIGDESQAANVSKGGSPAKGGKSGKSTSEQQLLAELDELETLGVPQPTSRPHTPRLQAGKRSGATPIGSTRTSEERVAGTRRSGESTRSGHTTTFTPSATSSDLQDAEKRDIERRSLERGDVEKTPLAQAADASATSGGGGWWGGIFATASAAVKTAEAAVKEIQSNEEAMRWAEQVKGNVGALRGLGGELRSRALPTFTNILHTLAPPISSHERLNIHITHDFIGYPSLDPLIHATFSRVMSQVEGGDLLVIQRGQESTVRRNSEAGYSGGDAGWDDGPWWRQSNEHRDLGAVKGLVEGTKLVRVSAESYAIEFFSNHGGLELAAKKATEDLSESNPVRTSDIFLAVQAISHETPSELFQSSQKEAEQSSVYEEEKPDELISFAIYLHDPVHTITFRTVSQSIPAKWIHWLDAPSPMTPASSSSPTQQQGAFFGREEQAHTSSLPEEIAEIIESGGVDPREWVAEWTQETLSLSTAIVAQRYVAMRMGVGHSGLGKGKQPVEKVVGEGGGEAARAGLL